MWLSDKLSVTHLMVFVSPPQGEGAHSAMHHRDGRKQDDHYQLKSEKHRRLKD